MRAAIIVNPWAGHGKAVERARQAWSELRAAGMECELACNDRAGGTTTLAREYVRAGYELIFAAGGDGTINEVANGIAGSGTILGIVPAGLANVWASEVGMGWEPGVFGRLVRHGLIFDTDLGLANGRDFLVMAGVGFDATVAAAVTAKAKARWGRLAYVLQAAATALRWKPHQANITIDGHSMTLPLFCAIAANASGYAGVFQLASHLKLDDGLLHVVVFRDCGIVGRARSAVLADERTRRWDRCAQSFTASELSVTTAVPLPIHTDAEVAGWTPCRITVAPRALPILLPADARRRYLRPGRPMKPC